MIDLPFEYGEHLVEYQGGEYVVKIRETGLEHEDVLDLCPGIFLCFSYRYRYGHQHVDPNLYEPWKNDIDVYVYIHSGVQFSTTQFYDPWDSMRIGVIRHPRGRKLNKEHVKEFLEMYTDYVNGNWVYVEIRKKEEEYPFFETECSLFDCEKVVEEAIVKNREVSHV